MTITESPSRPETYQPAPVKKRRAASITVAAVAGVAGLALAATFGYFQQDGSADYDGETTTPVEDVVEATNLELGTLAWSGPAYSGDDAPLPTGDPAPAAPSNAYESSFTITNRNTEARQIVRLMNVVPGAPDSLYQDIWVHIERQDPTGEAGANEFRYFGPLSELSNVYMGNIIEGATHTFDVWAWTATSQPDVDGGYSSTFTVNYSVADGAFEEGPEAP